MDASVVRDTFTHELEATRGLLVASDERRFTIMCRPSPDGLWAAAELLEQFRPPQILVLEGATLWGDVQPLEQTEPFTSQERAHARVDS